MNPTNSTLHAVTQTLLNILHDIGDLYRFPQHHYAPRSGTQWSNCRNQAITLKCPPQAMMSVIEIFHQLGTITRQTRSCHSNPPGRSSAANSRWTTRRGSGFTEGDEA